MPTKRRRTLAAALALPLAAGLPQSLLAADPLPIRPDLPPDYVGFVEIPRFFPETQHNADGEFLAYFRAHGGLDAFGYPLTEEFWELEGASGTGFGAHGRMVQYFQRGRLEYDLAIEVVRRSALGEAMGRRQPAVPPLPGVRYFPETGHNLGGGFLRFFVDQGGLETLGYPISEEAPEHGHTAQWFQNARLEWWPENPPGRQVQYGLIGEERLRAAPDLAPAAAREPAPPLPPLREWLLPPAPAPPIRPLPPLAAPILYYHQVPAQAPLRAQIRAFKEVGRTIVPLRQVVQALRGEASLPAAPLALTFDDGWGTQFANAAPVLQAEGVPATFFVITGYLDRLPGYMTWDQVRVLKELGHDVESHTQNHANVDTLRAHDEGAALAEIWESLAILESRLGRSQRLFAYPNGNWDDAVAALVARVYRGAVATGGGVVQAQDRLYALRRIKAEPSYRPERLLEQMEPAP